MISLVRVQDVLVRWKSTITGAVERLLHEKLNDRVSVKDFGVIGDGVADDSAAMQVAVSAGCELYIPSGTVIKLGSTVQFPAKAVVLVGAGRTSVITGTASALLRFNAAFQNADGFITNELRNFRVQITGAQVGIKAYSTWSPAGKPAHVIEGVHFTLTGDATNSVCIDMQGIWAAVVSRCEAVYVGGLDHKLGYGGKFLKFTPASDMNTSVMNVLITNNTTTCISYCVLDSGRVLLSGGRTEGVKVIGNNFIAGITAYTGDKSLAINLTGNQFSDFVRTLLFTGCFEVSILGNTEITGDNECLYINGNVDSFSEDFSITGNNFATQKDGCRCIVLSNAAADYMIRNISIVGNTFKGRAGVTDYGVFFAGTYIIDGVVCTGNGVSILTYFVFLGGNEGSQNGASVHGNVYSNMKSSTPNRFVDTRSYLQVYYTAPVNNVVTLAGGAKYESVSLDISAHKFLAKPVSGSISATLSDDCIVGAYDYDASTSTTAVFRVLIVRQATIPAAGIVRFTGSVLGLSSKAE